MDKRKGFTLIEILAAVAIVGVLSSFVIVKVNDSYNATKDAKRKADIELIKNALVQYRAENYSQAPVDDCEIGSDCTTFSSSLEPFLATLPTDPDSGKYYIYESDGSACTLYATLSDGSVYKYECTSNSSDVAWPVNGECGDDDGETFDSGSTPTNLCNEGTASAITGTGPWFWNCAGENEGSSAYCMASLSDTFTCTVTSGACGGADVFHMYYDSSYGFGGHAELPSESNYEYKVCCTGGGVSNSCEGSYAVVLNLYDTTKSHVEKNTQSNYTNHACISATSKEAECVYASSCATGYVCLASISDGDTSLHVGDCGTFTTKVCCKLTSY